MLPVFAVVDSHSGEISEIAEIFPGMVRCSVPTYRVADLRSHPTVEYVQESRAVRIEDLLDTK